MRGSSTASRRSPMHGCTVVHGPGPGPGPGPGQAREKMHVAGAREPKILSSGRRRVPVASSSLPVASARARSSVAGHTHTLRGRTAPTFAYTSGYSHRYGLRVWPLLGFPSVGPRCSRPFCSATALQQVPNSPSLSGGGSRPPVLAVPTATYYYCTPTPALGWGSRHRAGPPRRAQPHIAPDRWAGNGNTCRASARAPQFFTHVMSWLSLSRSRFLEMLAHSSRVCVHAWHCSAPLGCSGAVLFGHCHDSRRAWPCEKANDSLCCVRQPLWPASRIRSSRFLFFFLGGSGQWPRRCPPVHGSPTWPIPRISGGA